MKKVLLSDIAKELGVSRTLVSLVLNGKGNDNGISAQTQQRVLKKAEEMKYKPNQLARGLRTGKSNVIGLIVADISNPFYAKIIRYLEDHASRNNYNLMICSSDEDEEKELKLISMLRDRHVDGLIISSTMKKDQVFRSMVKENFPFVLIDRKFPKLKAAYVGVDNYQGGYEATSHLIKMGYNEVGFLTISPSHINTLRDRYEGYKAALKDQGIQLREKIVREIPFNALIDEVYKYVLLSPYIPRAFFIANNNLAMACMMAFKKLKLRVPIDVALISFDDIEIFSFTDTPVTAVAQPIKLISQNAFELLMHQIQNKVSSEQEIILPTQLIVRESCGFHFLKKP